MLATPVSDARAQSGEATVDTFGVPSGPSKGTTGSALLKAGVRYHVIVTGTTGQTAAGDSSTYDAAFCFESSAPGLCDPPYPTDSQLQFALRSPGAPEPSSDDVRPISQFGEGTGAGPAYTDSHRYEQYVTPASDAYLYAVTWPGRDEGEGFGYSGSFAIEVGAPATGGTTSGAPPPPPAAPAGPPTAPAGSSPPAFGADLSFQAPAPRTVFATTSPKIPRNTRTITLSAHLDGAAAGVLRGAVPVRNRELAGAGDELLGMCIVWGAAAVRRVQTPAAAGTDPLGGLFSACVKVLEAAKPATAAPNGCVVRAVAVTKPGRQLRAATRRRAAALVARQLGGTCATAATGATSLKLFARTRPHRALNAFLGSRVQVALARSVAPGTADGPDPRLVVGWDTRVSS
jgi:hypothetical protein